LPDAANPFLVHLSLATFSSLWSNVTVFLTERPRLDSLTHAQLVRTLVRQAQAHGLSVNVQLRLPDRPPTTHAFRATPTSESFGFWYERVCGGPLHIPLDTLVPNFAGGSFAVHSDLALPASLLDALTAELRSSKAAANYPERAWWLLFAGARQQLGRRKEDALDPFALDQTCA